MWCHQGVLSLWWMLHREKKNTACSVGYAKFENQQRKRLMHDDGSFDSFHDNDSSLRRAQWTLQRSFLVNFFFVSASCHGSVSVPGTAGRLVSWSNWFSMDQESGKEGLILRCLKSNEELAGWFDFLAEAFRQKVTVNLNLLTATLKCQAQLPIRYRSDKHAYDVVDVVCQGTPRSYFVQHVEGDDSFHCSDIWTAEREGKILRYAND